MAWQNYSRRYLAEFVYGAIDGTVTTFAIIAAVSGAALSSTIILILAFANVLSDGFSMAASNYLSTKSEAAVNFQADKKTKSPLKTATVTFVSFILVGSIPVVPFVLFYKTQSIDPFFVSALVTGLVFLLIGYIRGRVTGRSGLVAALETLIIGTIAALVAYLSGNWLEQLI